MQQFSDWETDTQAQLEGMSSWKNSRLMTFDSHNRWEQGGVGGRGGEGQGPYPFYERCENSRLMTFDSHNRCGGGASPLPMGSKHARLHFSILGYYQCAIPPICPSRSPCRRSCVHTAASWHAYMGMHQGGHGMHPYVPHLCPCVSWITG